LLIVESGDSRLVAEANRYPDPRRVDINVPVGSPGTAPLPGGILPDTTRAAAWLCREHACLPPIVDPEILADELRTRPAPASTG
jgi:uncharacterized protein YyaL (SSP411 family)